MGLRENLGPFSLLVLLDAFVGAVVGVAGVLLAGGLADRVGLGASLRPTAWLTLASGLGVGLLMQETRRRRLNPQGAHPGPEGG